MSRTDPHRPDSLIDASGLSCGALEPLLWESMRVLEGGQILEVRSDFPATREGVPSWCWLTGNALVAMITDDPVRTRFFLRKQITPAFGDQ